MIRPRTPLLFLLALFGLFPRDYAHGEKIRVATYNVRNYLLCDRMVEGKWRPNYPKPEKEKAALRATIAAMNADILALQEMGDESFMEELLRDLRASGVPAYPHVVHAPPGHPEEVRRLAVLSRIPPLEVKFHRNLDFKYFEQRTVPDRGLLEILFETNGVRWRLFNLHLKSKWTERKDDPQGALRREREARAMRDHLRQTYPPATNPLHLVVGDFNDHLDSAPLRRFLTVSGNVLARVVPCSDSRGQRWTHHYAKQDSYTRVDYLLATPAIFERFVPRSGTIRDEPAVSTASDHRSLHADFAF